MMTLRSTRGRVLIACLVSGLLCGLLTALQCERAEAECQLAALRALSDEPVTWTLWLHWVNWLPGLIFGVIYALASTPLSPFYWLRAILFGVASAASYVAALLVFSVFLTLASGHQFAMIVWIGPSGVAAGLVGALLLRLSAQSILFSPHATDRSLGRLLLSAGVGAVAGTVFVLICSYGEQQILLALPIAFAQWQMAVGLTLLPRMEQPGRIGNRSVQT